MSRAGTDRRTLREIDLQSTLVYGPVSSRRLGRSLGINPLPIEVKACTYDCLYCQYGLEAPIPSAGSLAPAAFPGAEELLGGLVPAGRDRQGQVAAIPFPGNGEPPLHTRFPDLVEGVSDIRDSLLPGARVALLSNATTICDARIREAILRIDDPILKIDAGEEETWRMVNRPDPAISFDEIIARLGSMEGIIVQSMFFAGDGGRVPGNAGEAEVGAWLDVVERVAPRLVQVYTLDRTPAIGALRPVPEARLREIGSALQGRGIGARVF